jgi:signal transduction histidine kinase
MRERTPSEPVSSHTEAALREVIARSATQGERIVSVARAALVGLAIGRTVWLWRTFELPPKPAIAQAGLMLATASFSLFVIVRYRTRNAPASLLTVSTVVDALICFSALAANTIWPGPGYRGLAYIPDVASVLVPTAAAGMRLSPTIAGFSGLMNLVSLTVLMWLDSTLAGPPFSRVVSNFTAVASLLSAVSLVAVLSSRCTRQLVREGAEKSLEAERAARNLGDLLRDHHDVRTLLSSASLNADLVLRSVEGSEWTANELLGESARQLREDLDRVNEFVANIKERAYTDLLSLRAPAGAPVAEAGSRVAAQLRARFPQVEISVADETGGASALVAGGSAALERVLLNLLVNACEGDGARGARRVDLRVTLSSDSRVRASVSDDGPGFGAAILRADSRAVATTKRGGSGLGLSLVLEAVEASGGTLERANRPEGGARVSVELPLARGAPAPE